VSLGFAGVAESVFAALRARFLEIYRARLSVETRAAQAAGMQVFVALFGYIPTNEHPHAWPASGWLDTPQAMATLLGSIGPGS
jgi:hypothetical protein